MKKILIAAFAVALLAFSCSTYKGPSDASLIDPSRADASYAFGVAIGSSIKGTSVELDYDTFLLGIKDQMQKGETKITMEQANQIIQTAIMNAMAKAAEANIAKETAFFAENGKKAGITTTASGLQYEVITLGTGPLPTADDIVKVEYEGSFLDGKVFDSSAMHGEPAVFPLGQVIDGWVEGIQLMPVGSKYKFYIPSALGYGDQGAGGGLIPPNSTLVFVVELLAIEAELPY